MDSINNMLNRIDSWNNPDAGLFKRFYISRAANFLATFPLEMVAIAQNAIFTPIYAASTLLKECTKIVSLITGSKALKNFQSKLPGFTDLLRSIARIVAYSLGVVSTLTMGIFSPKLNFEIHCAIGLAINKQEEAALAALEEIEAAEEAKQNAQREEERKTQELQYNKEREALCLNT